MRNNDMKVFITTLYKNNYGSALQCFALKSTISSFGYKCSILAPASNNFQVFTKKAHELMKILAYRGYSQSRKKMKRSMEIESSYLSKESKLNIDRFIDTNIQPLKFSYSELRKLSKSDEVAGFFVGSDQVWNVSRRIIPFYFLEFAPKRKRHTYAVSIGIDSIPRWNYKEVKQGAKGFNHISVREQSAAKILKEFSDSISVECDPCILLSTEKWRELKSESIQFIGYVFVHFLNRPSHLAIEVINRIASCREQKIICFAYNYEEYSQLHNYEFISGDPFEYIGLIDNAQYVVTDSYHTTLFSMIFNKCFYVLERQYLHEYPQTSRIKDLLKSKDLLKRFVEIMPDILPEEKENEIDFFSAERKRGKEYILSELRDDRITKGTIE